MALDGGLARKIFFLFPLWGNLKNIFLVESMLVTSVWNVYKFMCPDGNYFPLDTSHCAFDVSLPDGLWERSIF